MTTLLSAHIGNLTGVRRLAAAGAMGAVAALGQAPFDLWPLSILAFAGALMVFSLAPTPRAATYVMWAGGTGYFAVALHWIVEPFLVDVARHGWMAPFALLFLAGGLALFWAAAGRIAFWLAPSPRLRVWVFAGLLVLAEYARAHVFTGFPWAHPGHILIDTGLLPVSTWVGAHGLTTLVIFTAALAAYLSLRWSVFWGFAALLPISVAGILATIPATPAPHAAAPIIRLVQPNAPQHLKWRPHMIPVFFQRGLDLTAAPPKDGIPDPDLIIWPETSLPETLNWSETSRARLAEAANGASVLVGARRLDGEYGRNTMAMLDQMGEITTLYDKHHLVPFGEYLPFDNFMAQIGLRGLAVLLPGGYRPGPGPVTFDLPAELGTVFPMICYEAIFPGYIRTVPRPDWMVHITNDAWFGTFSGPYQHLALARLRAAEQGLPVLRAANTGISAVIDARGQVVDALALGTTGYLDAPLPPALPPTVYARLGDVPIIMLVLILTGGAIIRARR